MTNLERLKELLISCPAGEISNDCHQRVIALLVDCWSSIPGSDLHKTEPYKLARAEQLSWSAPVLNFLLARHGGTVNGSSREQMHTWQVDLSVPRAEIVRHGVRQLSPPSARMDVKQKATVVAALILADASDPQLKWSADRQTVQVAIAEVIPGKKDPTTQDRRKRFYGELDQLLNDAGWMKWKAGSVIRYGRP